MQFALSDTSIRFYQPNIILFVKTGARIYAGCALKINVAYRPAYLVLIVCVCFIYYMFSTISPHNNHEWLSQNEWRTLRIAYKAQLPAELHQQHDFLANICLYMNKQLLFRLNKWDIMRFFSSSDRFKLMTLTPTSRNYQSTDPTFVKKSACFPSKQRNPTLSVSYLSEFRYVIFVYSHLLWKQKTTVIEPSNI